MNIIKCFTLLCFLFTTVCLSSQQHGLLLSAIDDTNSQVSDGSGVHILVIDDVIYSCDGELCEGIQTDYYDAAKTKIRITGKFKNGVPVDEVKGYYKSGALKFSYIPYKKSYKYGGRKYKYCLYMEYNEQGNCIRYTDDLNGIEKKNRDDGSLISVLYYNRKKSAVRYYTEYYSDDRKKTIISNGNKYDYDEGGRLRRHWVRKSEKYNTKYGTMAATFYFVEYDIYENISATGRFYTNLYEHDQWLHVAPEFPVSLDSVPLQDFKEIINHQAGMKDVYIWDYANNKTIITTYKRQGDIWLEAERKGVPRIITN